MDAGVYPRGDIPGIESAQQFRAAVRAGHLRRVRHGWYATTYARSEVVAAVRVGGVLSCVSALKLHGVWVPQFEGIHIRIHHRMPVPAGIRICSCAVRSVGTVDDPLAALVCTSRCLDDEGFVVVCDSLLNQGLSISVLRSEFAGTSRAALVEQCDRAQSGTESIVRFRLRRLQIHVRAQVFIPHVGTVDLLVGSRLIIEVDSREFHDLRSADRDNDRRRDRAAVLLGYIVIRVSYQQVMTQWDDVEQEILAVVRADRHRRAPRGVI